MKFLHRSLLFTLLAMAMMSAVGFAYPETLYNGKLVMVDNQQGVAVYADKTSVVVENYNPPNYQIAISVARVPNNGRGQISATWVEHFRYNWNAKTIYVKRNNAWEYWDFNAPHPFHEHFFTLQTAEVAFVAAYNMRFFDKKTYYDNVLKRYDRIISEEFYNKRLGI